MSYLLSYLAGPGPATTSGYRQLFMLHEVLESTLNLSVPQAAK